MVPGDISKEEMQEEDIDLKNWPFKCVRGDRGEKAISEE